MAQILPSSFNRRITVKVPIPVTDDAGGTDNAGFTTLFTTWASVNQMKTSDKVQYGIDAFKNAFKVIFRWQKDNQPQINQLVDYSGRNGTETLIISSTQLDNEAFPMYQIMVCRNVSENG